jgi:hypothetical protein
MKTKLCLFAMLLVCSLAKADTITSGGLSFTCTTSPCSTTFPQAVSTLPTSGSFSYDITTNQFLSLTFTWDGIVWFAFFDPNSGLVQNEPAGYLSLLNGTMVWTNNCVAIPVISPASSCDYIEEVEFSAPPGDGLLFLPASRTSTYPADVAGGLVIATDVTTTPEPSLLVLLGIGLIGLGWRQLKA